MSKALHTPFREGDAKQVGGKLFRKQILPVGTIEYEGRTLDFTADYLGGLAKNFNAGAFDQVPFVLADADNKHTNAPERFRGDLKGVELAADGLYGLLELSDEGAKIVADNPKLGVSARIVEDGEAGPALQHVCGTLNPRAKGMKPWEAVELSEEDKAEVVDLTSAEYSDEMDGLTDTERATLDSLAEKGGLKVVTKSENKTPPSADDVELSIAQLLAQPEKDEPQTVELTAEQKQAIELADKRASDALAQVSELRTERDAANFAAEKAEWLRAGVPPADIDLAEPVLTGESKVIELTGGQTADSKDIVRKLLNERRGTIDLSEHGSEFAEVTDATREQADAWEKSDPQGVAS